MPDRNEDTAKLEAGTGLPQNGMSYVEGDTTTPLRHITIPAFLQEAVAAHGAREAVVFSDQNIRRTYQQFDRDVDRLAAGFLALGLRKGDRVGIWSPNRYEWVLTQFATARIGLILVNINPAYRLSELEFALNKVSCKALVTAKSFKSSDYLGMIRAVAPELKTCAPGHLRAARAPHLRHVIVMGDAPAGAGLHCFKAVLGMGGPEHLAQLDTVQATLDPDDAINIQFTSGTTGSPKGATLSHANILNNARFVADRMHLTETDRLCIPVPLYHCFGMVMGVLGCVSKGATMVFPGEGFAAPSTLGAIETERCTGLFGVPTMFVAMFQQMEKQAYDLTSLRTGIMAGSLCPIELMRRVVTEMHLSDITICYGMTETSPVSCQSFVDDPLDKRCSTVGLVHPHLKLKIIDTTGATVPVGTPGEFCTKGYSVMKGYWQDDDRTAESIVDGWMLTGDLAVMDADGYCTIVGRLKDMIIRGGENVYPREVEDFLFHHPDIAEVQVFGIPHPDLGEEVCAWAVPKPGHDLHPESVIEFCRGKIAHFKVPRHVRVVDELPMTITGKPQKFVMRDWMIKNWRKQ
jgi:fatty-acyl-CoA synthase